MAYFIRFECGRDDRTGPTLGPFEGVQLTYSSLRETKNGEEIALQHEDGDWFAVDETQPLEYYSDIIIWSEKD